jgi:hypothetical protein
MTDVSLESSVTLNDDVLFQELEGDAVLLDLKTGVYFGLDRVGTRMWKLLGEHKLLAKVVDAVTTEFDVAEKICAEDLIALVKRLKEQGLVVVD